MSDKFDQKEYIREYNKQKYKRVQVYFSPKDKQRLVDYCEKEGVAVGAYIKDIVLKSLPKT